MLQRPPPSRPEAPTVQFMGSWAVFTCLCSIAGVKCIYACVGSTEAELEGTLDILRAAKALDNTAVLCAPLGGTIGEKLATISAACSLGGER